MIMVSAASAEQVAGREDQIDALLRQRHRIPPGGDADFMMRSQEEIAPANAAAGRASMRNLLLGIAIVSLFVGGIGIMNIMLVSVTERTREIGIRMAIGARGRHVLLQFLFEAITLSVVGGLIGVLLGVGVAEARSRKFAELADRHQPDGDRRSPSASPPSIGIFFGFYPARKAVAARSDRRAAVRVGSRSSPLSPPQPHRGGERVRVRGGSRKALVVPPPCAHYSLSASSCSCSQHRSPSSPSPIARNMGSKREACSVGSDDDARESPPGGQRRADRSRRRVDGDWANAAHAASRAARIHQSDAR